VELYCKTCNHKLSEMSLSPVSRDQVSMKEGSALIDEGVYINANEVNIRFEQKIDILLNAKSVNLKNHKDTSKLGGCCGPGDLSVLNQVCPNCSSEIGMIVEDCWLPHFVGVALDRVSERKLW